MAILKQYQAKRLTLEAGAELTSLLTGLRVRNLGLSDANFLSLQRSGELGGLRIRSLFCFFHNRSFSLIRARF